MDILVFPTASLYQQGHSGTATILLSPSAKELVTPLFIVTAGVHNALNLSLHEPKQLSHDSPTHSKSWLLCKESHLPSSQDPPYTYKRVGHSPVPVIP